MKNQEVEKNPAFLAYVMQLNHDRELDEALQLSLEQINALDIALLNRVGLRMYEKGKWSIHKILQHLIDCKLP